MSTHSPFFRAYKRLQNVMQGVSPLEVVVKFRSITTRFVLMGVLVISLSVAAIVFYAGRSVLSVSHEASDVLMDDLGDSVLHELDAYIDNAKSMTLALSLQRAAQRAILQDADYELVGEFKKLLASQDNIEAIMLFNKDGYVVAGTSFKGDKLRGRDAKEYGFLRHIRNASGVVVNPEIVRSPVTNRLVFVVMAPVLRGGALMGGIAVSVDWQNFSDKVVAPLSFGKSGYAYMYDQNMRVISHPDPSVLLKKNILGSYESQIENSDFGKVRYTLDGHRKVAHFIKDKDFGWTVVTTAYERDLEADALHIRNVLLLIGVVTILVLSAMIAFVLWRFIMEPLARIQHFAEGVAKGDLNAELRGNFKLELAEVAGHIRQMTDQLRERLAFAQGVLEGTAMPCGVGDTEGRLTFVNQPMLDAVGLTGKPEEYYGMPSGEFAFKDPKHKTALHVALEEKRQVEQEVNYTTHKGEQRVFSIIATPIKDFDGKISGAMTLWFDLTEVRSQQLAIEEKNVLIEKVAQRAIVVSDQVASASEELSAQIDQSSKGADEQRAMASESATAIEQMNASVLEVARNAASAAETAENARSTAGEGTEVVGRVIKGFDNVHEGFKRVDESMKGLGAKAGGITNIVQVIEDIADQTNLLALNAAIEAARAGDAGRGFAVVADEVRKLAEKTMSATKEVGVAVSDIQEGTESTIAEMDQSKHVMQQISSHTDQAIGALRSIRDMVQETSNQVQSIASAAEEQSAASDQISKSAEEMNKITDETADAMGQSAQAVTDLARLAGELQDIINSVEK